MSRAYLAFTDRGISMAETIAAAFPGTVDRICPPQTLHAWTAQHFRTDRELIFVGALGIAVRAIAPFVKSKTTDPAVVVVDEQGRYSIAVLSGHLGGANELARRIAERIGAQAVITTATDLRGVFAADVWAKRNDCVILNPERIKAVSGKLLGGETVTLKSCLPLSGDCPEGVVSEDAASDRAASEDAAEGAGERADIVVDYRTEILRESPSALQIVPRVLYLGVGCRKGIPAEILRRQFETLMEQAGVSGCAVACVCSIDLKKEEPGLKAFAEKIGADFVTCSAGSLEELPGVFSASDFVKKVTGTDNVCERSAVCVSGGKLICKKRAGEGVTMALAVRERALLF